MSQLKVKLPQKALLMRRSSGNSCFCAQAQAYVREMRSVEIILVLLSNLLLQIRFGDRQTDGQ